jgi:hypothetical protein
MQGPGGHLQRTIFVLALAAALSACSEKDGRGDSDDGGGIGSSSGDGTGDGGSGGGTDDGGGGSDGSSGGSSSGGDDGDDGGDDGPKFDVGGLPDLGGEDTGDCEGDECECTIPEHQPCDAGTTNPFHAMGLDCPGELQVNESTYGPATAIGIRSSFGTNNTFDPREGEVYAVIGSGLVVELDDETPDSDAGLLGHASPTYCNDDLGAFDPGNTLPPPLRTNNVGAEDCSQNPALVGTGDCSNTIQGQFEQGISANDYVELRFTLTVPPDVLSFSYDFAFFSTEYPFYYGSQYNDMYVGWLEAIDWTGNVSFDEQGEPISLNAGFLEFKDDAANLPEFDGTCMRYHAGTNWLQTTAGVRGNEDITVVFAIFDLSDSILDSYVFLDNWQWGCDPSGKPETLPPG